MSAIAFPLILVTGPSGAGRTTATNALEDFGFEAIDNIPLSLIPRLLEAPIRPGGLALGLDVRNRDFSVSSLLELYAALQDRVDVRPSLLFLDCSEDALIRRFSETRRRHPLGAEDSPAEAVRREKALLAPLREAADYLLDTSERTPHDLRAALATWFAPDTEARLGISLVSFSYKRGLPAGADMVFDCRFLANPHWDATLRRKTGLDADVQDYIERDARLEVFIARLSALLDLLLPAHRDEGRTHVTIAFGCTGGQHRSVAITGRMAGGLAEKGWQVSTRHRELERRGLVTAGPYNDVQ